MLSQSDTFQTINKPINKIELLNQDPLLSQFKYHFIIKKLPINFNLKDDTMWMDFISNIYKGFNAYFMGQNSIYIVQIYDHNPKTFQMDLIVGLRRDQHAVKFYREIKIFKLESVTYEVQLADGFKTYLDHLNQKYKKETAQYEKSQSMQIVNLKKEIYIQQIQNRHHIQTRKNQPQVVKYKPSSHYNKDYSRSSSSSSRQNSKKPNSSNKQKSYNRAHKSSSRYQSSDRSSSSDSKSSSRSRKYYNRNMNTYRDRSRSGHNNRGYRYSKQRDNQMYRTSSPRRYDHHDRPEHKDYRGYKHDQRRPQLGRVASDTHDIRRNMGQKHRQTKYQEVQFTRKQSAPNYDYYKNANSYYLNPLLALPAKQNPYIILTPPGFGTHPVKLRTKPPQQSQYFQNQSQNSQFQR